MKLSRDLLRRSLPINLHLDRPPEDVVYEHDDIIAFVRRHWSEIVGELTRIAP